VELPWASHVRAVLLRPALAFAPTPELVVFVRPIAVRVLLPGLLPKPPAEGGRLRASSFWRAVAALFAPLFTRLFTLLFTVLLATPGRLLFAMPGRAEFTVVEPSRLL
jgi:hypothetical protein